MKKSTQEMSLAAMMQAVAFVPAPMTAFHLSTLGTGKKKSHICFLSPLGLEPFAA